MNKNDSRRIEDILEFASELAECVALGESRFREDKVLLRAIERLVELIGEAATAVSDEGQSSFPEVDWSGAVGMRTWLAHAYHRINGDVLWQSAYGSIPEMVIKLRAGLPHG